ncbi:hypothetical protein VKT23_012455 [Stygiomarasmius scandens]|uniref:Uncharacterized protein n=1 Tax=Marasmiellus scandens TaxID=2682957 RepID=A0ABR1J6L4_9AGAR
MAAAGGSEEQATEIGAAGTRMLHSESVGVVERVVLAVCGGGKDGEQGGTGGEQKYKANQDKSPAWQVAVSSTCTGFLAIKGLGNQVAWHGLTTGNRVPDVGTGTDASKADDQLALAVLH